jgi:opacity protein-like surface antigen
MVATRLCPEPGQGHLGHGRRGYPVAPPSTDTLSGDVRETMRVQGTVGLANLYWDLTQRGAFAPYIGAGIGFVYNDIERTHYNSEVVTDNLGAFVASRVITTSGKDTHVGLAAALMAGASISWDPRYAIDVNYRAMYLDGGSVTLALPTGEQSKATIGEYWEHQLRIGVRLNIW